jgi:tetratricopeptide (TPR) repeat protein
MRLLRARLFVVASWLALAVLSAQAPARVFVVVFDEEHLSTGNLKRLQSAATDLFTRELQPGDLGGVVVDGQLSGNRLLSDREELLRAVGRAHPRMATASDLEASAALPGGAKPSERLTEIEGLDVARAATERKLSVLDTLFGNLARVNGAKAVVVMSEGFGGDASSTRVRDLIAAAAKAGVRVHVLDEAGSDRDAASGMARGTGGSVTRRAAAFAPAIAAIGTTAVAVPAASSAAVGASDAVAPPAIATASAISTAPVAPAPTELAAGVVVAAPSTDPNVLRVRPLTDTNVMDLAGGDWSDAGTRAGWDAYQRGDLESARTALAPIAARPAAPSWVRYVFGQADYALGNFREAVDAWERVRTRQPQYEPVYLDLADGYMKLGEHRKSVDVLRAARQRWPKDPDLFNALGVIQAGGGDLDGAIKTLRQGIVAVPGDAMMHLNLAKALEMIYMKKRRESQLLGWRMGKAEGDLYQDALKEYRTYLATNGPYAELAREGLDRLGGAAPNLRPR